MIAGQTDKGFKLVEFNSDTWHTDEWDNWKLLDALLEASLGNIPFPVTGGAANAITLNYTPDVAVANGTTIVFNLTAAPTAATTVSVDGGTAYPLTILGLPMTAGVLQSGDTVKAIFDGTKFNVLSPLRSLSSLILAIGSSGATANTDADNFIISSNVHAGMSILTPNTQIASIYFADPENNKAGGFDYNHASNILTSYVNGVATSTLTSTGHRLAQGKYSLNLTGVNDFEIGEGAADVVRLGSSGAANGLQINVATGLVTLLNGGAVTGALTVSGILTAASFVGAVNLSTATGTVAVANGGTGAADAATARNNLGLGALATLAAVNNAQWSGADLDITNGGTGASSAAAALVNLGALGTVGGNVTGAIIRTGNGSHPFYFSAAMTGGRIFMQATGADPTGTPGDILLEW